jgi:hypothetical protein
MFECRLRLLCTIVVLAICLVSNAARADEKAVGEVVFVVPDIYSGYTSRNVSDANREKAAATFVKAREFSDKQDVGAALRWAARTLMFDPHHADARRVLGYQKYGDKWAGSYSIRQMEDGYVWHPKFGWIAAEDVAKYEAGQRKLGKRWITAEEDGRRHATIDDGWRIRTDHFQVTTDHSREAAAELATRLEATYQAWLQLCGAFFIEPADLAKRFAGQESSSYRGKPFQVIYYRTRAEYNDALIRQQPRIGMTLGIYFDHTRATHFFAGEDQDVGTITHEAVHQFFQESTRTARNVGGLTNAWIIEGIACYFESLHEVKLAEGLQAFSIGTPGTGRLAAAYQRCVVDGFYVPLEEFSRLGTTDLQRRGDIAKLYSQAAGLATFFMHYSDGIYRPALMEYLRLVYAGRDKPTTLQEVTGVSFAELDAQYREYLESLATATVDAAISR